MKLRTSSLLVACAAQQLVGVAAALPIQSQEGPKWAPLPYEREVDAQHPSRSGDASVRSTAPTLSRVSQRLQSLPLYDVDEAGALWAVGETYKASFGTAGATYVPFFGSRAPRNFPVSMRTQSIHIDGVSVAFAAEVAARRDGSNVSFDRGFVMETYAIARDGMEQRFVFEALPARGEIVVTIDVTSELEASVATEGFQFANDLGFVSYGRAYAFDARGEKIEIESQLVDGDIRLVVPAAFAERAALPLTIDPYVATFAVDTDAQDDTNPDVAFEPGSSNALVVYEYAFSATDGDVYAERYADQLFQSSVVIDGTATNWTDPRVAGNFDTANWLCVAAAGASPNRIIRGRLVELSPFGASAQFTISGVESGDKHDADVGGDVTNNVLGVTNYCVVWQRDLSASDTDIHARIVENDGTVVGGTVIFLVNSGATLDSNPSISKTNGRAPSTGRDWNIVFEHEVTSSDSDIQGARIHFDGTVTNALFIVASTTTDERDPTASEVLDDHGAGRPWLCIYEFGSALRTRTILGTSVQLTDTLTPSVFVSYGEPDVTTDGRLWHFVYRSAVNVFPFPDSDVIAASLSSIDGVLYYSAAPQSIASSSTFSETRPRIASLFGSNNPYRTYIAFQTESASNLYDILVGVYDSPRNAGGFAYCPGTVAACPCGNGGAGIAGCENSAVTGGALLTAAGDFFVSADHAVLALTQLPPGAPALYFQGTAANLNGSAFGDGLLCVAGAITRMAIKFGTNSHFPESGDSALHVAGGVPVVGGYRYYQAWHRDAMPFCTASNFNLSNGVAMLWAP